MKVNQAAIGVNMQLNYPTMKRAWIYKTYSLWNDLAYNRKGNENIHIHIQMQLHYVFSPNSIAYKVKSVNVQTIEEQEVSFYASA